MRRASLLLHLLLLAAPSGAQPARITSAYTSLDLDRCAKLDRGEEPQSASWRCKGFGSIDLFVQNGDDRYDVDAGREDRNELWADAFDYPGQTVEWRLAGGKPFAIIYRLVSTDQGRSKRSWLIVETIGGARPGCRVARIDGSLSDANARARTRADRIFQSRPACLKPE